MKDEFYENNTDDSYYFNFHLAKNNFMPAHYHKSTEIIFVRQGRERADSVGERDRRIQPV